MLILKSIVFWHFLFIFVNILQYVEQSVQISKNIQQSLKKNAPDVLKTYQSYLDLLDDIEIHD